VYLGLFGLNGCSLYCTLYSIFLIVNFSWIVSASGCRLAKPNHLNFGVSWLCVVVICYFAIFLLLGDPKILVLSQQGEWFNILAQGIEDSRLWCCHIECRCAKVVDQLNQDKAYVVRNPGSQFGICNCSWAEMGNLCEHMLKVINICRKRGSTMPSISLFQYHKALIDLLHCPPHDSLIHDHVVSF
jgi:hypothetical protein